MRNQIHVDKQVNAEDKFWIRWEKRRREELQETLQSIERELQEKQLDMQSYRENLQKLTEFADRSYNASRTPTAYV